MFMWDMILMRPTIAGCRCFGGLGCSTSTPSTRYFTFSRPSKGSMWMSLVRFWIASRISRFTRLTSVGCSAIRCTSSASIASRLFSLLVSARSPSLARLSAMRAAVTP